MKISKNVRLVKGGTTECESVTVRKFEELIDIILEEQYSLSTFKTGEVTKDDFESANCIGLDFDEGYSLKQAQEDFSDFKCIIATTKSHQKKKNGKKQDRFRVVLFLTEPITDIATFYATYKKLENHFTKLDPACKNPNRWFYPSKELIMFNKQGKKVKPVEVDETEEKPEAEYLHIGKGKLSKKTKKLLRKGLEPGSRNQTTYKIAKDFQENGFDEEEAIKYITNAFNANNTLAYDFTEEEVEAAVESAYSSDPSYGPRQPFKLITLDELNKTTEKTEWVVDKLLSKGGVSLWSAVPKAGKSWLARQLISQMFKGEDFLGRKTKKGEIHYYAIEEQPEIIKKSFKKFGLKSKDLPLYVHVGDIFSEDPLKDFYEVLKERKPVLAVIDTMFDFLDVESENNYKEVKKELRRLRHIARDTGTHILCIHHSNKGNAQYGPSGSNRSILGSTALAGGVDTIFMLELDGNDRILTATGRMVKPINLRKLDWCKKTWTYSLGDKLDNDEY